MESPTEQKVWYKKKRYIIPAGLLGLSLLLSGDDTSTQTKSFTSDPVPQIQEEVNVPIQTKEVEKVKAVSVPVQSCHPSYSGCLNPNASDYDCASGSGNGPYYTGRVQVIGPDVFDLDRDGDGVGCE
jgi:hypothetical protein